MEKPVMNAPAGEEFTKQLPTEGMVNAKCYAVIDKGSQENERKGVKKMQRQIQLSFETDQMWEFGDRGTLPLTIHKNYSFFITDNSNLQKDLTSRLGKPQTSKLNVFDLVGMTAELMVLHNVSKNGKTYPKIVAVKPWKKDWDLINPIVMFTLDAFNEDEFLKIPERLRAYIQTSPEYNKALWIDQDEKPEEETIKEKVITKQEEETDDLPF